MSGNQLATLSMLLLAGIFACTDGGDPKEAREDLSRYRIAYNILLEDGEGNYEIFVMNTDGTGRKNISNHPGVDWLYHSSNGRLFFVSDRDTCSRCYFLYSCDWDGDNLHKITSFRVRDSWLDSRYDGTQLVVHPHASVDSSFYIIDLQGKALHRFKPALPYFNDPCFSPDGQAIAFRGGLTRSKRDSGHQDEIYIMPINGGDLTQVSHYPTEDTTAQWYDYRAGPPRWTRHGISYPSVQAGAIRLFMINPDGTNQHRMFPEQTDQGWHAWSKGAQWLVYDQSTSPDGTNNYDIYLRHLEDSSAVRLTTSAQSEQAPVFVSKPVNQ